MHILKIFIKVFMCHSGNKNQLKFHYIRFFVQKVKSYIVDSIKAKLNEFKRVLKGCLKHPFYFYLENYRLWL